MRWGAAAFAVSILALSFEKASADVDADAGSFSIGILGPFTTWSHVLVAAGVAFDLDLRKNFEPALQARLGPPVIKIPDLHQKLNVTIQIGTTHSHPSVGLQTVMGWLNQGGSDRIVGMVGGIFSSISMPIAALAGAVEVPVPQIAYGATSPVLSDKQRYPFFCRVIPPDKFLAFAMWAWKEHFQVPSLGVLHDREDYGVGLYEAVREAAALKDEQERVVAVGIDYMPVGSFDLALAQDGCARLRTSGTRFVVIASTNLAQLMYALELDGMLYNQTYQFLSADHGQSLSSYGMSPSMGFPIGWQALVPVSEGVLFRDFEILWSRMTPKDIYSPEALHRYRLDAMQRPFTRDPRIAVTNGTFTLDHFESEEWVSVAARVFDAAYCFAIAINNLLNKGTSSESIRGQLLLDEVRALEFEGVTGEVSFDEHGDRRADYELFNSVVGYDDFQRVGVANPSKGIVRLYGSDQIMWASGTFNSTAPWTLMTCDPGKQWNPNIGRCSPCTGGFISSGGPLAKCKACRAGSSGNSDATACIQCKSGWFNDLPGGTCSECTPGRFSATAGASVCVDCVVGSFIEQYGSSGCEDCGRGRISEESFTTMTSMVVDGTTEFLYVSGAASKSLCGCDRRTRNSSSGECIACTEGLLCSGMGSVSIASGYYADEDLSVFRCYGDTSRCPGGTPGETCADGRKSLMCAECEDGMTPGSDGACVKCEGSDKAPLALALVLLILGIVIGYHLIDRHNRATQSQSLLLCAFGLSQFITTVQQMSIIGMLSFEWKDPLKSFLNNIALLVFNFDVLRLDCVGHVEPFPRYLMKVFAIFVALLLVAVIHGIFVTLRHNGQFYGQIPVLISAIGTILMVSYISVTSAVLEPLQCLSHPNGKWTVRAYPTIVCWDAGNHIGMLLLGSIMLLLVPLGFLTSVAFVVREFPKRLRQGDAKAVRALSFLFFRFKPGRHTYVLIYLMRSFLLALVLVVPHIMVQFLLLNGILLGGFAISMLWLPWRVPCANILEAVLGCVTLLLIALGAVFIPEEDKKSDGIAEVGLASILFILALVPLVICYGVWKRFFRQHLPYQFFLCHDINGSCAWTRLLKLHLLDSRNVRAGVFVDSDALDLLDNMLNTVGNETDMLVVVGTQDIFQRAWCIAEMSTARLQSVKTVVISLPGFHLPEDWLITDLAGRVNGLEALIESGMTVDSLQDTLRWIGSVPRIVVPPIVTHFVMDAIVAELCSTPLEKAIKDIQVQPMQTQANHGQSVMMCDHKDIEALAAGVMLQRMLASHFRAPHANVPKVAEPHDLTGSAGVLMAIVICTKLAFTRANFLNLLLQLRAARPKLVPVIAEYGFQIPGKGSVEQLHESIAGGEDGSVISSVVAALFENRGVDFQAGHASETVLQASAVEVAKQITSAIGMTLAAKPSKCSGASRVTSEEVVHSAAAQPSPWSVDL